MGVHVPEIFSWWEMPERTDVGGAHFIIILSCPLEPSGGINTGVFCRPQEKAVISQVIQAGAWSNHTGAALDAENWGDQAGTSS